MVPQALHVSELEAGTLEARNDATDLVQLAVRKD
jgi:hypothetical protein